MSNSSGPHTGANTPIDHNSRTHMDGRNSSDLDSTDGARATHVAHAASRPDRGLWRELRPDLVVPAPYRGALLVTEVSST